MTKFSRRDLIKAISAGTVLLPVGYALTLSWGGYPTRTGLKFLSDKEAAIFESIAEVVIPDDNALGLTIRDVHLTEKFDEFLGLNPEAGRDRIGLLFRTVEHVFPIRMLYFRKFTRLSLEKRRQVLNKLDRTGGVAGRALIRALKAMIENLYYNTPQVAKRIGFVGKCDS